MVVHFQDNKTYCRDESPSNTVSCYLQFICMINVHNSKYNHETYANAHENKLLTTLNSWSQGCKVYLNLSCFLIMLMIIQNSVSNNWCLKTIYSITFTTKGFALIHNLRSSLTINLY